MDWTPGGISGDIEDRRGDSSYGPGFGGFGFGGGGIGIVGILILLVISVVTGHNFLGAFLGGGGSEPQGPPQSQYGPQSPYGPGDSGQSYGDENAGGAVQQSAAEARDVQLISFALDDIQKFWTQVFTQQGKTYRHAKLVLFRNATYSGCGTAQAATGPFYCPQDGKVYIDLSFWDELKRFGGDTGDFAQSYVLAHELGHHVQDLLGTERKVRSLEEQNPREQNALSVDTELQADCYAGVWAHSAEQRGIAHPDDIAAALKAVAAVGDDHLQRMSGRAVSPENFTHGSSAQREHWLETGLQSGDASACDTYNGADTPE